MDTEWWRPDKLDVSRWRYLHDLVNDRIRQAKENLTAALADKLREIAKQNDLNSSERRKRLLGLEESVWRYFQKGEMDASHQQLLLEVIEHSLRSNPTGA